jgi:hypothetical protein
VIEKHFRRRGGVLTGANPIVTVWYGGVYEGIMSFGLDSAVVMKTDGTNAEATVALPGNLTVAGGASVTGNLDASGLVDGVDVALASAAIDGLGTMADQNANSVAITGGVATFSAVSIATTTAQSGYDLTVASGAYFGGAVMSGNAAATRCPYFFFSVLPGSRLRNASDLASGRTYSWSPTSGTASGTVPLLERDSPGYSQSIRSRFVAMS